MGGNWNEVWSGSWLEALATHQGVKFKILVWSPTQGGTMTRLLITGCPTLRSALAFGDLRR